MPSYLRFIFGGSGGHSSSERTKSSRRPSAQSAPCPIYAPAGMMNTPNPSHQRSYSYTNLQSAPSPLRYTTSTDTRTVLGYGKHNANAPHPAEPRQHVQRSVSYKKREPANYALYTPTTAYMTPPSSRSNSSTSLYRPHTKSSSSDMGHGARYVNARPILKQNQSWQTVGSAGSASSFGSVRGQSPARSVAYSQAPSTHSTYSRPRTPALHMHPLLAYTRLHRAPITYDVTFTPSARTVLDRATHSAIPAHTLAQPATEPATSAGSRLVLRSHKFPWPVIVGASSSSARGARFTIGPSPGSKGETLTVLDVLYAVHTTLMAPVTPEEWEALGHGSRAQQKVTRAYERRCTRLGGGWEGGVRRVDWLGEKTRLVGVEVDKSGPGAGAGKLVFAKT
ncbi:predicted protein [Sparassis crispa]|uniref:DUF6699 domain-containing protein n=1 Tax=Sparassis crispa TaxID=139825 RepID=A0A401H314_9APHY|nr:predicted protein [Sparassis crispa]GBE88835.1 predicted protein [Sparassis crispa]